jgi:hypothetical protein
VPHLTQPHLPAEVQPQRQRQQPEHRHEAVPTPTPYPPERQSNPSTRYKSEELSAKSDDFFSGLNVIDPHTANH